MHLANGKPAFLRRLFDELHPTTEALFYFDSNIVIECPWRFYEEGVGYGLALTQDMCETNAPLSDDPVVKLPAVAA